MRRLCQLYPDIRFRLSSIEPMEITEELLDLMAEQTISCRISIFHCKAVMTLFARMHRGYTVKEFKKIIAYVEKDADAAIGIDIPPDFLKESDHHFARTYDLLQELDCTYLHVFHFPSVQGLWRPLC